MSERPPSATNQASAPLAARQRPAGSSRGEPAHSVTIVDAHGGRHLVPPSYSTLSDCLAPSGASREIEVPVDTNVLGHLYQLLDLMTVLGDGSGQDSDRRLRLLRSYLDLCPASVDRQQLRTAATILGLRELSTLLAADTAAGCLQSVGGADRQTSRHPLINCLSCCFGRVE